MLASSRLQTIISTSRLPDAERFYGEVLALPLKGRCHGGIISTSEVAICSSCQRPLRIHRLTP